MFFLWWFFLSHVTFTVFPRKFEMHNEDYMVRYYYVLPTNIIGIYSWFFNYRPEYIVLYDKNYNYIGQSSPFCIRSNTDLLAGEHVLPEIEFTNEYDSSSFYISGGNCQEEYEIPTKTKKWWSQILQYFHL
ncbi:DUF6201 family protein [Xenorhabdus sp. PR6a]|nr:DUF6201 family protein [Xenorhabdus sp. PR6a]MDC9583339.1 DUF6201 family protein [Xenorhabdus sp. PR6a]